MKAGLLLALLSLLAGCAAAPSVPLQAPKARVQLGAVATLAVGNCDVLTAADYTGVIVARRNAATLLRGGQISPDTARRVQSLADTARAALDATCRGGRLNVTALDEARAARSQINQLIEGKP
jgi:hypothetical protein